MNPSAFVMLASLLGFLLIGCEKVPTFQELTGQEANKNSPAVANTAAPTVTPEKDALKVAPIQPAPAIEDPAEVLAALTRKSGMQLTDREIVRATKVPMIVEELKSLDVSRSTVTDEGVRLLGHFTALTHIDLSALQINGAGIEGLESLGNLRELALASTQMGSSTGWERLGRLSQVETLNLTSTNITDADVSSLVTMTGLKELNISNTALTDAALNQFAKLENLEILRMEGTRLINGAGFKAFVQSKRKPGLRCLYASSTPLSREGLSNVKKIGSLEVFENASAQLSDQLFSELKGATNLKTLGVGNNNLTAASGLTIKTIRNLENLDLRHNSMVTPQILASLTTLTELSNLNVTKTGCTLSSVQEFRRLRKKCTVIFDDTPSQ